MPRFKNNQLGVISPILIIIVIVICLVGVWFFISGGKNLFIGQTKFNSNNTSVKQSVVNISQVDKKDKDWMYKYCQEEIMKLPEAPFKYISREGPTRNGPMVWVSKMFPKDTRFDHQSGCAMDYKYGSDEAYASLGVKNGADIKYTNEFKRRVDELITSKIDSSWKKISPLNKEQSGNPGYSYQGFPMIFKRENADLGTVEYIDIFFGANTLYIKIEFYVN